MTYCDVQGGWTGTGNIDVEPGFAFPSDYRLLPGSPCLDAGTNEPTGGPAGGGYGRPAAAIDGDGDGQAVADMGAYEFNPAAPTIALSTAELTFLVAAGQSASQTLGIRNSSLGTLTWELDWQTDWLSADPAVGESSGEIDVVTLTVDAQALTHGRHDGVIWVIDPQASNSPRAVSVILHVGQTLNVPADYATIQAAIDAASPADVVLLADGVYTGPGNKDLDFYGKLITVCSGSGDPAGCVIDCEHEGARLLFPQRRDCSSGCRRPNDPQRNLRRRRRLLRLPFQSDAEPLHDQRQHGQ